MNIPLTSSGYLIHGTVCDMKL